MNENNGYDKHYCQDNGCLKNKLGITDSTKLNSLECKVSFDELKINMKAIRTLEPSNVASLFEIHKILFGKIYDWAGQTRIIGISKDNYTFASPSEFDHFFKKIFNNLNSFEDIVKNYVLLNYVHCFREGNGRSMRIWLNLALEKIIGKVINFENISLADYMSAMMNDDVEKLKTLFGSNLIEVSELSDKAYESLFINNAKTSYRYEGLYIED